MIRSLSDSMWSIPLTGYGRVFFKFYVQGLKDAGDNRAEVVEEILFGTNFTEEKADKIKQILEK